MKLSTVIGIIIIAAFFLFPILTNFAVIPEDIEPQNIGEFLGGIFQYWIIVISKIFKF
ncbi:conserved exported hypothetical protein [groundwater metagenome]|uniref:Uncharacterized protein n=1 Tax=groundwater metagenome TaxID=717931 RepID=A0A098EE07_9ZZZZ